MTEQVVSRGSENGDQAPPIYGLRLEDITQERLIQVLRIYGTITGVSGFIERNGELLLVADMRRQLDSDSVGIDLRYGSTLSGHTKLMSRYGYDIKGQRVVKFYINPNVGQDSRDYEKGEQMVADFGKAVGKYLQREGIARELSN